VKTLSLRALSLSIGIGLASSAEAAKAGTCQYAPCVFDSNNALVGAVLGDAAVLRKIGQDWFEVDQITAGGIYPGGTFLYASEDCSGQPQLFSAGALPRVAYYDGQSFWAADTHLTTISWGSYASPAQNNGTCVVYGKNCLIGGQFTYCQAQGAPAIKIQTQSFSAPLAIKAPSGP
jgi:hypothetical protein